MNSNDKNNKKDFLIETRDYFLQEWYKLKQKKNFTDRLPQEDRDFLGQVLILTCLSEGEISKCRDSIEFKKIINLLEEIKKGNNDLIDELKSLYINNSKIAISECEKKIEEYKYNELPDKQKKQVDNLKKSKKEDNIKIILDNFYNKNEKYKNLLKAFDNLKLEMDFIKFEVFNSKALTANPQIIEKIAYVIYKPLNIFDREFKRIINGENISCDWYLTDILTVANYKEFINSDKKAEDFAKYYSDAINNINVLKDVPIPAIRERRHILIELLDVLNEKKFFIAMISMFSLIEGLLWELAMEVNKNKKVFTTKDFIYDYKNNKDICTYRIRDVLEKTYVNEYLNTNFLKYFCKELYEERNVVLHGNLVCSEGCENLGMCIIKKVFTLDYILNNLKCIFSENMFKLFDDKIKDPFDSDL